MSEADVAALAARLKANAFASTVSSSSPLSVGPSVTDAMLLKMLDSLGVQWEQSPARIRDFMIERGVSGVSEKRVKKLKQLRNGEPSSECESGVAEAASSPAEATVTTQLSPQCSHWRDVCAWCGTHPTTRPSGLKTCGGCEMLRYCDASCQREAWRHGHKRSCGSAVPQLGSLLGREAAVAALSEFGGADATLATEALKVIGVAMIPGWRPAGVAEAAKVLRP